MQLSDNEIATASPDKTARIWNARTGRLRTPPLPHQSLVGPVSFSRLKPKRHNAFLWKNGVMTDLGNLGLTSYAHFINSKGQVGGGSRVSRVPSQSSAFLWEKGGPMIDLNTLIPANSSLHLAIAFSINDRGEIVGTGVPLGVSFDDVETLGHAFLLIPLNEE